MTIKETIAQTYAGKNVFITGGTGFIGKVLTEKLLRTCKDVGNIYWLSRPKKGMDSEQRLKKTLENSLFDLLRKENPQAFKKLKLVSGDISQLKLGLSDEDYEDIVNNVSIVFHVAATIRFNEELTSAILLNIRGTREICNLVLNIKNLIAFVHVSTAYCNHENKIIEERIYPVNANWQEVIKVAENLDKTMLNVLTPKFIGNNPTTYTFTKAIAEKVVEDICGNKVPSIIFRPSIVTSIYDEPLCGWTDNLNGPFSIWLGVLRGVIKAAIYSFDARYDIIPVDYVVKGMLCAVRKQRNNKEISVYNGTYRCHSLKEVQNLCEDSLHEIHIESNCYPEQPHPEGFYWFLASFYLFQLLPAFCIDTVYKLLGKKPIMMRIHKKYFLTILSIRYFALRAWDVQNNKFLDMVENLEEEEFQDFGLVRSDKNDILNGRYIIKSLHFMNQHILKGKLLDKPLGKQKVAMIKLNQKIRTFSLYILFASLVVYIYICCFM